MAAHQPSAWSSKVYVPSPGVRTLCEAVAIIDGADLNGVIQRGVGQGGGPYPIGECNPHGQPRESGSIPTGSIIEISPSPATAVDTINRHLLRLPLRTTETLMVVCAGRDRRRQRAMVAPEPSSLSDKL